MLAKRSYDFFFSAALNYEFLLLIDHTLNVLCMMSYVRPIKKGAISMKTDKCNVSEEEKAIGGFDVKFRKIIKIIILRRGLLIRRTRQEMC